MGVQRHNVPHFKGLIMLYLDNLKMANLLHKMARVPSDLNTAVYAFRFAKDRERKKSNFKCMNCNFHIVGRNA